MFSFRGKWHVFIASFLVFIVLNLIENLIHYNIGRNSNSRFEFMEPTLFDWTRIILTMIIFALLQGMFTLLFDSLIKK